MPRAVADVEYVHLFLFLHHAEYRAVDVRSVAAEQVPDLVIFGGRGVSVGLFLQTENRLPESPMPDIRSDTISARRLSRPR
jgi:hypothetical protein